MLSGRFVFAQIMEHLPVEKHATESHNEGESAIKLDPPLSRLCTKFAHVHVQKISFVAISSRASSRGKMIPPKSPTSFQCPR